MIKNDVKSGVSVPENLKNLPPKAPRNPGPRTKTQSTKNVVHSDPPKPRISWFAERVAIFARHGVELYRTDWRLGHLSYFAIKNKQVVHISTVGEMALVLWAWGENHV